MTQKRCLKRAIAVFLMLILLVSYSLVPALAASAKETYVNGLVKAGFPTSYAEKLYTVHQKHANWKFTPVKTGLDFDDAIAAESINGRCNVYIKPNTSACATRLYRDMSTGSYTAKNGFDYDYQIRDGSDANQTGWMQGTPMAVAYYMNPYTFIGNDISILQFESLEWNFGSYNEAVKVVESILSTTFMSTARNDLNVKYVTDDGKIQYIDTKGAAQILDMSYAQAICTAAKDNNLNPCYLASKIIGEVGSKGSSSITGTYNGYTGYYNFLNIGAYDSSSGAAVANGLRYAKSYNWCTPLLSIQGGAAQIASYYIARGQNTAYLQKFNVTSLNTYGHQYMTAANGVVNTTYSTYNAYKKAGILESAKTFYIPVFTDSGNSVAGTNVQFKGYEGHGFGTVNATVNLRSSPSYAGTKTNSLSKGTKVTITGGYRDTKVSFTSGYNVDATYYRMFAPLWYQVKTSSGETGYICEDYLDPATSLTMTTGSTENLQYTVGGGSETPRFFVQDNRIAKVSLGGVVTAVSKGTTKVVVYLANGAFDVINLTVRSAGVIDTVKELITSSENTSSTTLAPAPAPTQPAAEGQPTDSGIPSYSSEGITLIADSKGDYYTYRNGQKVNYTGIAQGSSGDWWYCENGALRLKTVVARNEYGWWYCENGKITGTYNGLVTRDGEKYVCQNSYVNENYNGSYTYNGKTYQVQNGKVIS